MHEAPMPNKASGQQTHSAPLSPQKHYSYNTMKIIIALCFFMIVIFILVEIYAYVFTPKGYINILGEREYIDFCRIGNGPDICAGSAEADLHPSDLHLVARYERQMEVNHAYIVSVTLSSSKENVPLSALSASVTDGQSVSLRTLFGKGNTPCVSASLIVDQTVFSVQPSQLQEYPLEQSKITWIWSVTPLSIDLLSYQDIPVQIILSGKTHCGSGDALAGPYQMEGHVLDGNSSLSILVTPPFYLSILVGILALLLLAFLARLSVSLWQRRRKKGRYRVKVLEKERFQPATMRTSLSIFYCYAHEDKALRDQLEKHLSPLQRYGQIINWYDGEIAPGTLWEDEIRMQLNSAHIILLLISPDFIASNYCYSKEMTRAIERHHGGEASVIPIILRPVVWDKMPFADLQVLPSEGKPVCSSQWSTRDEAFYDVVQGICLVVETLLTIKTK